MASGPGGPCDRTNEAPSARVRAEGAVLYASSDGVSSVAAG